MATNVRTILLKLARKRITLKDRHPQYDIGRESYGNPKIRKWGGEQTTLTIGAFCSFASKVQILLGGNHRVDWVTTFPLSVFWKSSHEPTKIQPTITTISKGNVQIGNDVWVGTEAMILSGVTIGDGAVIGARAVVTKDVPPYTIVAGNPARIVRPRFDENTIQRLLKIKWWNWDDDVINEYIELLLSHDIDPFLEKAESLQGI